MASEVFNCEMSKVTDLFFTSRSEVYQNAQKKHVSSSPLPKNEESSESEEEGSEFDDKENTTTTH